jgi:hypothetical protein
MKLKHNMELISTYLPIRMYYFWYGEGVQIKTREPHWCLSVKLGPDVFNQVETAPYVIYLPITCSTENNARKYYLSISSWGENISKCIHNSARLQSLSARYPINSVTLPLVSASPQQMNLDHLHCTFMRSELLRVSPSLFTAAQEYSPADSFVTPLNVSLCPSGRTPVDSL